MQHVTEDGTPFVKLAEDEACNKNVCFNSVVLLIACCVGYLFDCY
jgi:hypothetical protein